MRQLTLDKKAKQRNPLKSGRAERIYRQSLTVLAEHVGKIITGVEINDPIGSMRLQDMLRRYADALIPWAEATAMRMIAEVNQRDIDSWQVIASEMSEEMRREIISAPTGQRMQKLMREQVSLIRSIPLDAAQRVHDLSIKALEDGSRFKEIAEAIYNSGEVAKSSATLIARTEVSRTAANLTQARAEHVGSTHYLWMTSKDADVRSDHRALAGNVFAWDSPPVADRRSGARAHPGCIYNCRCWAKPIIAT